MPIKIAFGKEIHICKNQLESFSELLQFISMSFKCLPLSFNLFYEDQDGDRITLSCDEDFRALLET